MSISSFQNVTPYGWMVVIDKSIYLADYTYNKKSSQSQHHLALISKWLLFLYMRKLVKPVKRHITALISRGCPVI